MPQFEREGFQGHNQFISQECHDRLVMSATDKGREEMST